MVGGDVGGWGWKKRPTTGGIEMDWGACDTFNEQNRDGKEGGERNHNLS